jgi:hypothetical protein
MPEQLLAQWKHWHDMVDSGSPNWIVINPPTDMVLAGYLVFEGFLLNQRVRGINLRP